MHKIYLIEDDSALAASIRDFLQPGFIVKINPTGENAASYVRINRPDLVLLDINLPGRSGLTILQTLRTLNLETPVIVITAQDSIETLERAFSIGADGFISKPFSNRELLARTKAILKRKPLTHNIIQSKNGISLDKNQFTIATKSSVLPLRKKEFEILELLASAPGRIFNKEQIINNIWSSETEPMLAAIDVHISNLRRKLKGCFGTEYIKTRHGVGFYFTDDNL